MGLRIVFFGTPAFSLTILQELVAGEHEVVGVVTQPDRRSGRGRLWQAPPVKQWALEQGIPVCQFDSLKDKEVSAQLGTWQPDVCVVVAYGLIIPATLLSLPPWGFINVHASLLPAWRGAAPIQRAIMAGDKTTGITIMQMDAGLDTGPMLLQKPMSIGVTDTSPLVFNQLANLGAKALLKVLSQKSVPAGVIQDDSEATYAHKIGKKDGWIDWSWPMTTIHNYVRALQPWPVVQVQFRHEVWRVWWTELTDQTHQQTPGCILEASATGIDVACGDKTVLRLQSLQRAGGRRIEAVDFCNSHADLVGDHFQAMSIGGS